MVVAAAAAAAVVVMVVVVVVVVVVGAGWSVLLQDDGDDSAGFSGTPVGILPASRGRLCGTFLLPKLTYGGERAGHPLDTDSSTALHKPLTDSNDCRL